MRPPTRQERNRVTALKAELTRLVAPSLDFSVLDQTDAARRYKGDQHITKRLAG
jgi:hypothetical protein